MKQTDARRKIRAAKAMKRKSKREAINNGVSNRKRTFKNNQDTSIEPTRESTPAPRFRRNSKKRNTVLMFSSGLDSTAALYWMLENTDDNIYVHRIVLDNKEGRSGAESVAAKNIIRWFRKNCRKFDYQESHYSYNRYTPYDMYIYMHMAGIRGLGLRRKGGVHRVVTGSIKMYRKNTGVERRRAKAWNIFSATYGKDNVEWFKPLISFTKEDVFNLLPRELSDLTHSCRSPKGVDGLKSCGRCHSCMAMKRVRGRLTAQQIRQFRGWNE